MPSSGPAGTSAICQERRQPTAAASREATISGSIRSPAPARHDHLRRVPDAGASAATAEGVGAKHASSSGAAVREAADPRRSREMSASAAAPGSEAAAAPERARAGVRVFARERIGLGEEGIFDIFTRPTSWRIKKF
ncbi:unnamed protein product [Miscanthus lutarioriparius]|uniref:Uncharacterized protein n=1 Tax=Miscanthus lutarioriparius TaxID=422564 RepID=A0A811NN03_9POAL|nr:unnamed protein product [Miscanthus lutarioriparius]